MAEGDGPKVCARCAQDHELIACPYVKALNFRKDGKIKRVEFLTPADMLRPGKPNDDETASGDYPKLTDR